MIVAFAPFGCLQEAFSLTEKFGQKHNLKLGLIGYPSAAPFYWPMQSSPGMRPNRRRGEKALAQAREYMEALVRIGCVPHRVGTDFLPIMVEKLNPGYYEFVKRIKRMLDPKGIMNPGSLCPRRPRNGNEDFFLLEPQRARCDVVVPERIRFA